MALHIRFVTYFPHVDNIYSHRSTQRYKRKPFVSHYWDCRLKGRPPGTPKSDDPNKRKRKRQARERDLCDVKIKITEYFPGARTLLGQEANGVTGESGDNFFAQGEHFGATLQQSQPFGVITTHTSENLPVPGSNGERFFTIQRVNGNGGNGKGDGVAGPHKHSLADSDRVKKNSIQRQLLKDEKEMKKLQVCYYLGGACTLFCDWWLPIPSSSDNSAPANVIVQLRHVHFRIGLQSHYIYLPTQYHVSAAISILLYWFAQ